MTAQRNRARLDAALASPQLEVDRAVADLRRGLAVAIEGDGGTVLAQATEFVTGEDLAQLRAWTSGDVVLALTAKRAGVLNINPSGSDPLLIRLGGLEAADIQDLADPTRDLSHPMRGPFRKSTRIAGPAEQSAIRLLKLARLLPSAVLAPVASLDGDLARVARVSAAAVDAYPDTSASGLRIVADARVPLEDSEQTRLIAFRPDDGGPEHFAILIGDPARSAPVLARIHSECFTGDLLGSLKCDCGDQLRGAIRAIAEAGGGVVLYLAQEGRGIGLISKLKAYRLQDQGYDTVDANERLGFESDERVFLPAARMLQLLGFSAVRLMTNNPDKMAGLEQYGIRVTERVAHAFPSNVHNAGYLATKARRSGHLLPTEEVPAVLSAGQPQTER